MSQNTQDLLTGLLDSQDGALQILLLVDYIFNLARDLYRHGIIARLLRAYSNNTSGVEVNDTVSISLEIDFSSMNQGGASWQHQMELDPYSSAH